MGRVRIWVGGRGTHEEGVPNPEVQPCDAILNPEPSTPSPYGVSRNLESCFWFPLSRIRVFGMVFGLLQYTP